MGKAKKEADKRQWFCVAVTLATIAVFTVAFLLVANLLSESSNPKNAQTPTAEEEAVTLAEAQAMDPFYVLLIGSDSRKGTALYTGKATDHAQVDQHSDVMTLVRVDPMNFVLTLISVPRDTQLKGSSGKINDSLLNNNPEDVVLAVETLTGVEIPYYFFANFVSFPALVNDLGGVTVDVPVKITVVDPAEGHELTLKAGKEQTLNGSQALAFARARQEYNNNPDVYRQANVRQILVSMIQAALKSKSAMESDVESLSNGIQTNMDLEQLLKLGLRFQRHKNSVVIYATTGPYEGGDNNAQKLWVVPEDERSWKALMAVVDAGEDPSLVIEPLVLKESTAKSKASKASASKSSKSSASSENESTKGSSK